MMKPDVSTCVAIPEAGWNRKPTIKQTNIPHYIYIYFFVIWLLHPFLYKKKNIHTHKKQISANLPSSVAIHQTIYSIPCHSVQNHNINLIHQGFSTPPPPPRFVTTIQKGKLKSASNPNDETTTKKKGCIDI